MTVIPMAVVCSDCGHARDRHDGDGGWCSAPALDLDLDTLILCGCRGMRP